MTAAAGQTPGRCRACGSPTETFLRYGHMPLANSLVDPRRDDAVKERFPLTLTFCPRCALVQLRETIDPNRLFREYVYLSSNSAAFVSHARALAQRLVAERALGAESQVIEIASNDGYLLQHYRDAGVAVLGIEPARAIAQIARERGIPTEAEFFTRDLAQSLGARGIAADIIHANNVLAHVPDLDGFIGGIAAMLKPDGVAVIEFPYLIDLIDRLEFDTVYHEHVFYFSLTPLVPVFARHGLRIADVERIAVHGGSLRLFARHGGVGEPAPAVSQMLEAEHARGADKLATFQRFALAVERLRTDIRAFLVELRATGKTIAAYGAAAKGATLLNYCGIGRDLVDFVVDRSPLKQRLAMPGVHLPILPTDALLQRRPDYVLLLAWNFAAEIIEQQSPYHASGGRFIVPVPRPAVL